MKRSELKSNAETLRKNKSNFACLAQVRRLEDQFSHFVQDSDSPSRFHFRNDFVIKAFSNLTVLPSLSSGGIAGHPAPGDYIRGPQGLAFFILKPLSSQLFGVCRSYGQLSAPICLRDIGSVLRRCSERLLLAVSKGW
ncbi:hypothetical protein NPIL_645091 [Nephila pilipes]|uniref:Uncharacterized protein n=1 Tax=Nephila pilipes TaxID=299642 RepID=A0A8X6NLN3_NEPPI|nr:hypothetical protein NPIL_645091 [Nephila pilipes]